MKRIWWRIVLNLSIIACILSGCAHNEDESAEDSSIEMSEAHSSEDVSLNYRLYTPESNEQMPLVIAFHGYGDTEDPPFSKAVTAWTEPENQEVRPCYVLAPVIADDDYIEFSRRERIYEQVKNAVDSLIKEGKVDKTKVYVAGNSLGGMATVEYAEKYHDSVAGALALCPAINYSAEAENNLSKLIDVPIWFLHAANDNVIPVKVSREAVENLKSMNAKDVHITEFTNEEMIAVGASYGYHEVDIAVMAQDTYMKWLFEQSK